MGLATTLSLSSMRINTAPVRSFQHFYRMQQNRTRCHQHIRYKEILVKDEDVYKRQCPYHAKVIKTLDTMSNKIV